MKSKTSLVAVTLVVLAVAFIAIYPKKLFSPGELHKSHAGIEKCETCHTPFTKTKGATCVTAECHEPSKWEAKKGYFATHLQPESCTRCHVEHAGADGNITVVLPHTGIDPSSLCLECHRLGSTHIPVPVKNCRECHYMDKWKPATFDHEKISKTDDCLGCHPLPEKHFAAKANCGDCHMTTKWKPATLDHEKMSKTDDCLGCHPLPEKHFAAKANCGDCHDTDRWTPADFKHRFPIRHGERRVPNRCETCHPVSLDKWDCTTNCHTRGLRGEHLEEGIINIENCVKCHPTGREHEGEGYRREGGGEHGKHSGEGGRRSREHDEEEDDD